MNRIDIIPEEWRNYDIPKRNIMNSIKATEDFFELIEELIQTGAVKNFKHYCLIIRSIEKKLNMDNIYITAVFGKENNLKPNEVEFHYGWEKGDEKFRNKKTIISNIEWQ